MPALHARMPNGGEPLKTRLLFAALAALVVAVIAGTGGATAGTNPKATSKVQTVDCINAVTGQDEGDITYDGPDSVWPPNHKYVTANISVTDADSEPATDGATASVVGSHDQILEDGSEMNGSGNTDPATDVVPGAPGAGTPTATTSVQFRAERSGHKWTDGDPWRGRTYTFTVNGTTDNGLTECEPVNFTANVPHDQGNHTGSSKTTAKKRLALKRRAALRARRAR